MILRILLLSPALAVTFTSCCCGLKPAPPPPAPDAPPPHKTAAPKHGEVMRRTVKAQAGDVSLKPATPPAAKTLTAKRGEDELQSVKAKVGDDFFKTAESAVVDNVTIYSQNFIERPQPAGARGAIHAKGPLVAIIGKVSEGSIKVLVCPTAEGSLRISFEDDADPAMAIKGLAISQLDGAEIQPWKSLIRHK